MLTAFPLIESPLVRVLRSSYPAPVWTSSSCVLVDPPCEEGCPPELRPPQILVVGASGDGVMRVSRALGYLQVTEQRCLVELAIGVIVDHDSEDAEVLAPEGKVTCRTQDSAISLAFSLVELSVALWFWRWVQHDTDDRLSDLPTLDTLEFASELAGKSVAWEFARRASGMSILDTEETHECSRRSEAIRGDIGASATKVSRTLEELSPLATTHAFVTSMYPFARRSYADMPLQ
jgi:hypothetical protein